MNAGGVKAVVGKSLVRLAAVILPLLLATACASVDIPDGRTAKVPATTPPHDRYEGLNEKRDPITRVRLGKDVLVPQPLKEDVMPDVTVGPYELRGETLASALQLILDEYDVSLAFESDEGLKRRITVSNLHGKLKEVVNRVCSLANLYCHFEQGTLTIKNTETFVVDLPPIGGSSSSSSSASESSTTDTAASSSSSTASGAYTQIAAGLAAVIGTTPTVDETTRIMIYTATQRSNKYALQYFERLRKNTALIIFETHIWEVTLNNSNRTGINWNALFSQIGNFSLDVQLPGAAPTGTASPISITPTYTGSGDITTSMVLEFISERGAVKTVSQPQITVLSGSKASLNVQQSQNYVSGSTRTPSTVAGGSDTVSITTGTATSGLSMSVTSAWDQSTVYGNLNITLNDLLRIDSFQPDDNTTIQLPQTTERSLQTEIRVRPGDAILIGGLVSEKDDVSDSGPGFMKPLFATTRGVTKRSTELVFLLRPRVVAFIEGSEADTVPVVLAPKGGIAAQGLAVPDITESVKKLFGSKTPAPVAAVAAPAVVPKAEEAYPTALPTGMSPEALAPKSVTPAVGDELPASLQEQYLPVPLADAPAEKDDAPEGDPPPKATYGGVNP